VGQKEKFPSNCRKKNRHEGRGVGIDKEKRAGREKREEKKKRDVGSGQTIAKLSGSSIHQMFHHLLSIILMETANY
jgi:hypothetical protein